MCTRACKIEDQCTDLSQSLLFAQKKNHKVPQADLDALKELEEHSTKRRRLFKGGDSPSSTDSETESVFDSQASTLMLGEGMFVGIPPR